MSFSFEEIKKLQIGDEYYECSGRGGNNSYTVEVAPIQKVENDLIQLEWTAKNSSGDIKKFLITKGMEHYGPKLYEHPVYLSFYQINDHMNKI